MDDKVYYVDRNYLEKFFVGLLDGDGSISISLIQQKYFQFTIRIELKFTEANENMLNLFCSELQIGKCFYRKNIFGKKLTIIWVEQSKTGFIKILEILKKYPLLTKIRREQLIVSNWFFQTPCLLTYNRNSFKDLSTPILYYNKDDVLNFSYFSEWLSGFIEAEGSFFINQGKASFNICQNYEEGIILAIKEKFEISSNLNIRLTSSNNTNYLISTSKKSCIINICNHIKKYPLLGEKCKSFNQIID